MSARIWKPSGSYPIEIMVTSLRETPSRTLDTPESVRDYLQNVVATAADWRCDQENFVVLCMNVRRRVICHTVVCRGTADSVQVHPREVFRSAIVANSAAIILAHNHPSGDPLPSEADIRCTRDLVAAGKVLKIEVLDHVILGEKIEGRRDWVSLRELGYFH